MSGFFPAFLVWLASHLSPLCVDKYDHCMTDTYACQEFKSQCHQARYDHCVDDSWYSYISSFFIDIDWESYARCVSQTEWKRYREDYPTPRRYLFNLEQLRSLLEIKKDID